MRNGKKWILEQAEKIGGVALFRVEIVLLHWSKKFGHWHTPPPFRALPERKQYFSPEICSKSSYELDQYQCIWSRWTNTKTETNVYNCTTSTTDIHHTRYWPQCVKDALSTPDIHHTVCKLTSTDVDHTNIDGTRHSLHCV